VPCSSFARPSPRLAAALAALAALVLPACQVTTSVGVNARSNGSGEVRAVVTLDKDAAGQVPDLGSKLRVADLRAAGWRVDGPKPTAAGGLTVSARKAFATPAEAAVVIGQLSGPSGPFQDFAMRRTRSFAKTRLAFRGTVDLSKGLASFSDPALRSRLGGTDLGFDPAQLQSRLGQALARVFPVKVSVRLPGQVASNAPLRAGNGAQWSPAFGEHVTLVASSEQWNAGNLAAAAVSVAAALALAGWLVAVNMRSRSSRKEPDST
jgi:hypothetical protein